MKKLNITSTVLAAAFSLAALEGANAEDLQMQKCKITGYNKEGKEIGLIKAGKGDCTIPGKSSCTGENPADDPEAWIYLPAGDCDKIVGGTVAK